MSPHSSIFQLKRRNIGAIWVILACTTALALYASELYLPGKLTAIAAAISSILGLLASGIIIVSKISSDLGRTDEVQDAHQRISAFEDTLEYLEENRKVDKTDPRFDEMVRTIESVFGTEMNSPTVIRVERVRFSEGIYVDGEILLDENGRSCRIIRWRRILNDQWDKLEEKEPEAEEKYQNRLQILGRGVIVLGGISSIVVIVTILF